MRLKPKEIQAIKKAAKKQFGAGAKIFLFGSREDDSKKGGDIDLYIETASKENLFRKKVKMIRMLKESCYEKLKSWQFAVAVSS